MTTEEKTSPAKSLLNPREASAYVGLSESHLAKLRCWGQGPRFSKLGSRSVRYLRADLDAWISAGMRTSTATGAEVA